MFPRVYIICDDQRQHLKECYAVNLPDGLAAMIRRSCILDHQLTYFLVEKLVLRDSLLHELHGSILLLNYFQRRICTELTRDVKNLNYLVS